MFETAQWAQGSEAAQSLSQMAARGAAANPALAALARERQDLGPRMAEARRLAQCCAWPSPRPSATPKPKRRTRPGLPPSTRGIGEIDASSRRSSRIMPRLPAPRRCRWQEVQALLGAGRGAGAVPRHAGKKPTPEETFIWVVTKTEVRWVRSELGTAALAREVEALRCGLERAPWERAALPARQLTACAAILHGGRCKALGKPLPFDPARAHRLYKALFGQGGGPHPRQAAAARALGARSRSCRSRCW